MATSSVLQCLNVLDYQMDAVHTETGVGLYCKHGISIHQTSSVSSILHPVMLIFGLLQAGNHQGRR